MKWNKQLVLVVGLLFFAGQSIAEERFFFDMPRDWALVEDIKDAGYQEMVFVPFSERESPSVSRYIRKITLDKKTFDASSSLNGRITKMTAACSDSKTLPLAALTQEDVSGYRHEGAMFWCVDKVNTKRSIGAIKQITADDHVFILERIWHDNTKEKPTDGFISKKETMMLDSFKWAVVCNDVKQAGSCSQMQQAYMASDQNKRQQAEISRSVSNY